jgi:Ca2+-binding RTX toxin-like protein
VFGAGQLLSIESIALVSAHDTRFGALGSSYSYNLTMNDGNVAAGDQLIFDAAQLRVAETLVFDGSAETDGSYLIFGGKNGDTITTGAGADVLQGGLGGDTLTGGGGADTFRYVDTSDSTGSAMDQIVDFTSGLDKIDLSRIDANTTLAGDQAFGWIGSDAFSNTAGELRAYQLNNVWFVEGDVNGDGAADLVIAVGTNPAGPIGAGDFLP